MCVCSLVEEETANAADALYRAGLILTGIE